jgi:Nif-specific regulatory protein
VQRALAGVLDAYRTAAAEAQRAAGEGALAARLRTLYTRALLLDTTRPSVATLRDTLVALVEALDADAGALVVLGDDGAIARTVAHNLADDEAVRTVSESVIARARAVRSPVNIERVAEHESLAAQASVVRGGLHAAVCVPILSRGEVWGAAYVDRRRAGARSFTKEDVDLVAAFAQQAGAVLRVAHRLEKLEEETSTLRERVEKKLDLPEVIGRSGPLLRLLDQLAAVADTDATVLLNGESGTGKELVARALHANSKRRGGPFVAVNCGAIPEALLESTLFGHKKGSFTGAVTDEQGLITSARGGTLFLDEIGDMPPPLQVKLLRVLQTGAFSRVGDAEPRQADVRWVAATHRDLRAMIADGRFREDLYYRLAVFELTVPPLRERPADVAVLADHFVRRYAERYGRPARALSADALAALEAFSWPGNVRELENVVQRAVILAEGPTVLTEHLPPALAAAAPPERAPSPDADGEGAGGFHDAVRGFKRRLLADTLDTHGGSRKDAAEALGLNRTYLSRLLRQLDLQDDGEDDEA